MKKTNEEKEYSKALKNLYSFIAKNLPNRYDEFCKLSDEVDRTLKDWQKSHR